MLATLAEIGAAETPQILVLNKIDRFPGDPDAAALARRILGDPEHQPAGAVAISARTGEGFEALLKKIDETLSLDPLSDARSASPWAKARPCICCTSTPAVTATRYAGDICEVEAVARIDQAPAEKLSDRGIVGYILSRV